MGIFYYTFMHEYSIKILKKIVIQKPYPNIRRYPKKEGILKKETSELLLRISENIIKLMMGKRGEYLSDILRSANTYFSERGYEAAKSYLKRFCNFRRVFS